jgi:hypothetical protein
MSEFFLHAKLDRQAMGVPAGFADDVFAFQGLVAAYHILDGACHHMVNAWGSVGTRWTFEKPKSVIPVAVIEALLKGVVLFPIIADVVSCSVRFSCLYSL